MIKKIVTQRGVEFELGQAAPSNTSWEKVVRIEKILYPVPTGQPAIDEFVVSLSNGEWIAVTSPVEVWYSPDIVPDTGA